MQVNEGPIPVLRGASAVTISMGFFSLVVFWWFPFGLILSSAGLLIGLFCLALGVRGRRGENYALIGTTICGITVSLILVLTQVIPNSSILFHL